jgi:hypothetical protein
MKGMSKMYLLPTDEELNKLWRQIDPKQRFLEAAAMAINELTERLNEVTSRQLSHKYTIGQQSLYYKKYLDNVPAGTYKIMAEVDVTREAEAVPACVVLFSMVHP